MEEVYQKIQNWALGNKIFVWSYSLILIITGIVYIFLEFSINDKVDDSLFIGLLFGASFILLFGIKWIKSFFIIRLKEFVDSLNIRENLFFENFNIKLFKIFNNPITFLVGLLYGIAVAVLVFNLDIWHGEITLNILLSVFLFIVNFLTGSVIYALINLFAFLYKSSSNINIGIYDRYNKGANFITDLSKRTTIIASFYVAFSITSIYFSNLPINTLIISYSIFAGGVILIAYIIPMIPIRNKILVKKNKAIHGLSAEIQNEFDQLIINSNLKKEIDISRYNSLIEIRSKVSSLNTLPIGAKTFLNSLSILIVTLIPIAVQVILENYL